jgi:hypothetical protein
LGKNSPSRFAASSDVVATAVAGAETAGGDAHPPASARSAAMRIVRPHANGGVEGLVIVLIDRAPRLCPAGRRFLRQPLSFSQVVHSQKQIDYTVNFCSAEK